MSDAKAGMPGRRASSRFAQERGHERGHESSSDAEQSHDEARPDAGLARSTSGSSTLAERFDNQLRLGPILAKRLSEIDAGSYGAPSSKVRQAVITPTTSSRLLRIATARRLQACTAGYFAALLGWRPRRMHFD